jgi:hypothetical protein
MHAPAVRILSVVSNNRSNPNFDQSTFESMFALTRYAFSAQPLFPNVHSAFCAFFSFVVSGTPMVLPTFE